MSTRRSFLLQATAATATASMVSVRARSAEPSPVHLGIYGLTHDHARYMLPFLSGRKDIKLVGIIEPNRELVSMYANDFQLDQSLFVPTLEDLAARTKVHAVAAFTSTVAHKRVVESCAARGIHVMMEKPMAVSLSDARAMAAAAAKGGIEIVINYDTTWFPSMFGALEFLRQEPGIGDIRKIVARDGNGGPARGSSTPYFLSWLTDPALNGGGALMDFGCYGVNQIVTLMQYARPTSVSAVTQTFQPDLYPRVDDEATIVIAYPKALGIVQASWNWPHWRKDLDIYGADGELHLVDANSLMYRESDSSFRRHNEQGRQSQEVAVPVPKPSGPNLDAFAYLAAVVRREIKPSGLSSLEGNLLVTEILDAARESAQTGRRIYLDSNRSA
jgi:predicted dehydrogenase